MLLLSSSYKYEFLDAWFECDHVISSSNLGRLRGLRLWQQKTTENFQIRVFMPIYKKSLEQG
jgi:hypothetical protein